MMRFALAGLVFLASIPALFAADGDIDVSFGTDGRLLTGEVAPAQGGVREGVMALPDGTMLYYGFSPFEVRRYTTAGIPDASFGTNGATSAPNIGFKTLSNGVIALDKAGRIYAAAGILQNDALAGVAICRFDPFGVAAPFAATQSPCTGTNFATSHNPRAMRIDATGGMLVLGTGGDLVRFKADGSVDTAFAPEGRFVLPHIVQGTESQPAELTLGNDGAIYVVGEEKGVLTQMAYAIKLRIDVGTGLGFVDPIFNGGAPLSLDCGGLLLDCTAAAAVIDGPRLVVAGTEGGVPVIVRLDLTTGQAVVPSSLLPLPSGANAARVNAAVRQHDGDLLVAGTSVHLGSTFSPRVYLARVRLGCNGATLDAVKFGTPNGSTTFSMLPKPEAPSAGLSLALGIGRVYVGGHGIEENLAAITAIVNANAFVDGIFANGFEACD